MERERIYSKLGLSSDAGLFISKVETDAFAKCFVLHFLHEDLRDFRVPKLTRFRLAVKNCRDVKLDIEGEVEPDIRTEYLRGAHDVLDITLGKGMYKGQLVVFSLGFSLTLKYEVLTIELE